MVKRWCARAVMVLAGVLLAACASDKVPAEAALKAADRDAAGVTKVNLNTATQRELESLRGIGPATAKRIIRHRPYVSIAELSQADVAGPIIELITPRVTVGPAPAQSSGK